MKKTMTNAQADLALAALNDIMNSKNDVAVSVGFRIMQNIRSLQSQVQLYREENDKIIRQMSGGREKFTRDQDPEKFDECQKMLRELAGIEVDVEIAEIDIKDLLELEFPMKDMFALELMTKIPAEKEENDG